MAMIKATKNYLTRLSKIEDFIFEQTGSIKELQKFHAEHDRVIEFIKQNPTTPAPHPNTGDQSWPFSNGRYRLFFKYGKNQVFLLDLIDNRMVNIEVYPLNSVPSYVVGDEDES